MSITPNDAFFVRYHLAGIPLDIDPDTFTVEVKGKVDKPLKLSLADLKTDAERSRSSRSTSARATAAASSSRASPAASSATAPWAMRAGGACRSRPCSTGPASRPGARQVTFNGLDGPVVDKTPDFVKALDIDHARDGEVMLAYAMNGQDLPFLNGFPLRLVVPGYYGTYWVKHLNEITVHRHGVRRLLDEGCLPHSRQ